MAVRENRTASVLAQVLPVILGVIAVVVVIWAVAPFRSSVARAQPGFRAAIVIGIVLGVFVAILADSLLGSFGCFDSEKTAACYTSVLPAAVIAGISILLASVVGYGILARLRARSASDGALARRIAFLALAIGAVIVVSQLSPSASQNEADRASAELAARSAILHVTVSDVHTTMAVGGSSVSGVHIRVTLHTDADLRLREVGKSPSLRFVFETAEFQAFESEPASQTITTLTKASDGIFDVNFVTREGAGLPTIERQADTGSRPPLPGTWVLRIDVYDAADVFYQVKTNVVVSPAA